ncbi:DUF971 domain-containing protein [Aquabacter spiritensis]|uniref:DUF971 family protein n=1 Tax=Aquabacter spiritensis TaxID=933073 RepID=A0A4R3LWZ0_9HYPH|nr:DUF971 domain-containing protein [Aquabacter spiritensis]TCT05151.1 DUF971 family protein [Aquabacter spiritensis]
MMAPSEATASLFDPAAVPDEIRLNAARDALLLTWDGAGARAFGAERLRAACRCAWCTRARAESRFPARFPGIAVTGVAPVADYALNLFFSDGHERGIYPFSYLRALADADLAETTP